MISLEYGLKSRNACGMQDDPACRQRGDFAVKLCAHSAYFYFQLIGQISLLPSILTLVVFSPTYNLSLTVSHRFGGIRGIIDT